MQIRRNSHCRDRVADKAEMLISVQSHPLVGRPAERLPNGFALNEACLALCIFLGQTEEEAFDIRFGGDFFHGLSTYVFCFIYPPPFLGGFLLPRLCFFYNKTKKKR